MSPSKVTERPSCFVLGLGDLAFVQKLRLALDTLNYLRGTVSKFDAIAEIFDDGAPPIATVGF